MIVSISNGKLSAKINTHGAELTSLSDGEREYIWAAKPHIWGEHSPILFPFIGRLKDRKYTLDGKEYRIGLHGFASSMEFQLEESSDIRAAFLLRDTKETFAQYPFRFEFRVIYELDGKSLRKSFRIDNLGDGAMYAEVGGHDGYSLELFPGDKAEDYSLVFDVKDKLDIFTTDERVLLLDEKRPVALDDGALGITMERFSHDALIFEATPQHKATLRHVREGDILSLDYTGIGYLGIWTQYRKGQNAEYICLEPWAALPDFRDIGYEAKNKPGIYEIAGGASVSSGYRIDILK